MTAATPIRWGLLGTGNITFKLLAVPASRPVDVVAVGSRTIERAREFAGANGIGRAHGSYEDLLGGPGGGRRLHQPAQLAAPRVDAPLARRGQARAVREAVHPAPGRGR